MDFTYVRTWAGFVYVAFIVDVYAQRIVAHFRLVGAPAGWADGLPGVSGSEYTEGRTVLTIEPGTDDQQILKTALSTGPVHEFSLQQPSLTDLFREVVAA